MNILVEAIFSDFKHISGIERYALNLLKSLTYLGHKATILLSCKVTDDIIRDYRLDEYDLIFIEDSYNDWVEVLLRQKLDILHCTFVPPPPGITNIPILYTLHDPGRYLYTKEMDLSAISSHMERFESLISYDNFYVVTVSNSSKADILKFYASLEDRLYVVYNYVNSQKGEENSDDKFMQDIPQKFYFTVGKFHPLKNSLNLIKAWEKYIKSGSFKDEYLVILGRCGWYHEFENYISTRKIKNFISINQVTEAHLKLLYKNAISLICPSIYEGFGYPIIEGVLQGIKNLYCSDIPVFREVAPKGTVFFNPLDIQDITEKCFLTNNASSMDFNRDEYFKRFSFVESSLLLNEVYSKIKIKNNTNQTSM